MSDPTPPRDDAPRPDEARADRAVRELVAAAGADAPSAPDPAGFGGPTAPTSIDRHRRRRWIAGAGAIGLSAAAAVALVVVGTADDGGDSVILPATPSTVAEPDEPATTIAPTPTTTISPAPTTGPTPTTTTAPPSTTTAPVSPGSGLAFAFTPLLPFGIEDDGYRLDVAVSSRSGSDAAPTGFVEFSNDDPTRPRLEIVLAEVGPESVETLRAGGAATFEVDGREVFDGSPDGGCSDLGCTLYVQWDDSTGVSVGWVGGVTVDGDDIPLPADGGRTELLDVVAALQPVEPASDSPWFRPVVLPFGPTVAERSIITADASGVVASRYGGLDGQLLLDDPSSTAIGLPDGRVIVESGVPSNGLPDDLVIVSPLGEVSPFWIDGVPDDGSVRISLQDASIADGEQLLLFVTSPGGCVLGCPQTLQAATVPWIEGTRATELRVVRELGFGGEGPVRIDLLGDVMLGVEQQLETKTLVSGSIDGNDAEFARIVATPFEEQYSESDVLIALENSGYSVESSGGTITIRDHVGDGFAEIDLDGLLPVGVNGEPIGPLVIEPNLVRNGPQVLGSVWVRSFEPAADSYVWIEVGLDGEIEGRITVDAGEFDDANAGSLRVTNR